MNKTVDEILDYLEYAPIGGKIKTTIPDLPAATMHIYSGYFLWVPDHPGITGLKTKQGKIIHPVLGLQLKNLDAVKDFFQTRTINESDLLHEQ